MGNTTYIPTCGLAEVASDARAAREDPPTLHGMTPEQRKAYEAVDYHLRRNPRDTELRACKTTGVDYEFYLEAKRKAIAGPSGWANCSKGDLIRPESAIIRKKPVRELMGMPDAPSRDPRSQQLTEKQQGALDRVEAYLRAHPRAKIIEACRATGTCSALYSRAVKKRALIERASYREGA